MAKVTSTDIKKALAKYHPKDYFLTECKTCSTYFPAPQGMLKFDGLAMTRSYTAPCITGYEIKVSRSDFLGDNKWHLYLQYCNEFYFVVPVGLVAKNEIPEDVGLIYYYPETGKLLKKRRAVYRKIEEILEKHQILGWSWCRNPDDTLKDLDDALSSSYPKELGRVEDNLQRALDDLRRIKENHLPKEASELC